MTACACATFVTQSTLIAYTTLLCDGSLKWSTAPFSTHPKCSKSSLLIQPSKWRADESFMPCPGTSVVRGLTCRVSSFGCKLDSIGSFVHIKTESLCSCGRGAPNRGSNTPHASAICRFGHSILLCLCVSIMEYDLVASWVKDIRGSREATLFQLRLDTDE